MLLRFLGFGPRLLGVNAGKRLWFVYPRVIREEAEVAKGRLHITPVAAGKAMDVYTA
jgi:hypothetical protein